MLHQNAIFALLTVCCYVVALLTSTALVRWILPRRFCQELGSSRRNIPLDGIRGYLAFGVFLHHYLITWNLLSSGTWQAPQRNFENELGRGTVAVFFMITAYLFWSRAQARKALDLRQFFVSRFFRIYPLYLFMFLVVCLTAALKQGALMEPGGQVAREVFLWLFFWAPDINAFSGTEHLVAGVTWSLRYELWFYLSLPFLVFVFLTKNAVWKKALALAACAVLFRVALLQWTIAIAFCGGILAVYWRSDPRRAEWAKTRLAAGMAIAALGYLAVFRTEPFDIPGVLAVAVFFVIVASGNTLFGLLKMQGALWMGEVSYSTYLCHGFLLWLIMQKLVGPLPVFQLSRAWFAMCALAITPLLVLFSSATYILIERPFINLGHRLGKPSADRSPVPSVEGGLLEPVDPAC